MRPMLKHKRVVLILTNFVIMNVGKYIRQIVDGQGIQMPRVQSTKRLVLASRCHFG